MVCTGFFQSIGKAKVSMFLSLSRQLLFLLPLLIVLPNFYQVDGVWYAQPISDFISAVDCLHQTPEEVGTGNNVNVITQNDIYIYE